MHPLPMMAFSFTVDVPNWLFSTNTLLGILIGLALGLLIGRAAR